MGRMHRQIDRGDVGGPVTGENDTMECPRCGRETGNLPKHMRACDGGED